MKDIRREDWDLAFKLLRHFYRHRLDRMYRTGRCDACGSPWGYILVRREDRHGEGKLLFRETCECWRDGLRLGRKSGVHSWFDLANELRDREQELHMLFDYDLDLLDLEEGCEADRAHARPEHAS